MTDTETETGTGPDCDPRPDCEPDQPPPTYFYVRLNSGAREPGPNCIRHPTAPAILPGMGRIGVCTSVLAHHKKFRGDGGVMAFWVPFATRAAAVAVETEIAQKFTACRAPTLNTRRKYLDLVSVARALSLPGLSGPAPVSTPGSETGSEPVFCRRRACDARTDHDLQTGQAIIDLARTLERVQAQALSQVPPAQAPISETDTRPRVRVHLHDGVGICARLSPLDVEFAVDVVTEGRARGRGRGCPVTRPSVPHAPPRRMDYVTVAEAREYVAAGNVDDVTEFHDRILTPMFNPRPASEAASGPASEPRSEPASDARDDDARRFIRVVASALMGEPIATVVSMSGPRDAGLSCLANAIQSAFPARTGCHSGGFFARMKSAPCTNAGLVRHARARVPLEFSHHNVDAARQCIARDVVLDAADMAWDLASDMDAVDSEAEAGADSSSKWPPACYVLCNNSVPVILPASSEAESRFAQFTVRTVFAPDPDRPTAYERRCVLGVWAATIVKQDRGVDEYTDSPRATRPLRAIVGAAILELVELEELERG